jgi:diacylglycerol O-acyltransferase / wax synthase
VTERLSTLDASFLAVERRTAHMHVGWKALFAPPPDGNRPSFETLREHVDARLRAAPRYHQRLATVPLGANHPVWVDDPDFDIRRHVRHAPADQLDEVVDDVMSEPLRRDRPLWEMWLADLPDGGIAMVGKAHHCMVDGIAAVELTSILLDASPDGDERPDPEPSSAPSPPPLALLAGALWDRVADPLSVLRTPRRLIPTPQRVADAAGGLARSGRAVSRAIAPAAPHPLLNRGSSPHRHLVELERALDELRQIKARHGASVNDVLLAAVAGALRAFLLERGETPPPLKAMVPVSVRDSTQDGMLGNRISFVFVDLPCDEPRLHARLADVIAQMCERKTTGEPEGAKAAVEGAGLLPRFLQSAVAQVLASPSVFNLVVSNVPGPPVPLYLRGCRLQAAYPIVPLAEAHALSVGMMSVAGRACFGLYADRRTLPDANRFAGHLDAEIDRLLALG